MSYADLRKGRRSIEGQAYLLTAATHRRRAIFDTFHRASVVAREIHRADRDGPLALIAWVVMPDHIHVLARLRLGSLARAMNNIKGRSAREVGKLIDDPSPIWQAGFHDRALRYDESLKAVAWYVCRNPVRAGIVVSLRDYPFWDACWIPRDECEKA